MPHAEIISGRSGAFFQCVNALLLVPEGYTALHLPSHNPVKPSTSIFYCFSVHPDCSEPASNTIILLADQIYSNPPLQAGAQWASAVRHDVILLHQIENFFPVPCETLSSVFLHQTAAYSHRVIFTSMHCGSSLGSKP